MIKKDESVQAFVWFLYNLCRALHTVPLHVHTLHHSYVEAAEVHAGV